MSQINIRGLAESPAAAATRRALLDAAILEFAAFGYRRSSMESVARRAGLSRATLYLYWSSKKELMRSLVEALHADQLEQMRRAMQNESEDVVDRLVAVVEARFARFVALTAASPNAAELYDVHDQICGDIAAKARTDATTILEQFLSDLIIGGDLDLTPSGLPLSDAAKVLMLSAEAAKGEDRTAAPLQFHANLGSIIRLLVHGLTPPSGDRS